MTPEWEYRTLLAVDIERSAGRGNVALLAIRETLTAALRESCERGGVDWKACGRHDLGDGMRVIAPPGVAKGVFVHPLFHELAARLRAHNRTAGPLTEIRVRVALHAGEVRVDPTGEAVGGPLEVLARLLDAPPLRAALADAPASVPAALLVSRHVYEETAPHGYPGIDPEDFRRVGVAAKEFSEDAWLYLPGHAAVPRQPSTPDEGSGPRKSGAVMHNSVSGNGVIYATQHGNQHIHMPPGRR